MRVSLLHDYCLDVLFQTLIAIGNFTKQFIMMHNYTHTNYCRLQMMQTDTRELNCRSVLQMEDSSVSVSLFYKMKMVFPIYRHIRIYHLHIGEQILQLVII